ncbi:MAG TPA: DUF4342 domain-containing protein [Thermomicrobiaceae bacterium]|nr:DUF4342 domain-containing protein [Thermomicrobiaceae bacterium]
MQNQSWSTSFKTEASRLGDQIQRLVHEGNIRHVVVSKEDRQIARFSVTVGLVGAVIAPYLAVIALIVALVTGCAIKIEQETPIA